MDYPNKIKVLPTEKLSGEIIVPSSKSYTHRAIIAASLAEGVSNIGRPLISDDTDATIEACQKIGAQIVKRGHDLEIEGFGPHPIKTPMINLVIPI